MQVNISFTVKTFGGISLCNDGKLEESEGYNYFFVVFYVISKLVIWSTFNWPWNSDLLLNKSFLEPIYFLNNPKYWDR